MHPDVWPRVSHGSDITTQRNDNSDKIIYVSNRQRHYEKITIYCCVVLLVVKIITVKLY